MKPGAPHYPEADTVLMGVPMRWFEAERVKLRCYGCGAVFYMAELDPLGRTRCPTCNGPLDVTNPEREIDLEGNNRNGIPNLDEKDLERNARRTGPNVPEVGGSRPRLQRERPAELKGMEHPAGGSVGNRNVQAPLW